MKPVDKKDLPKLYVLIAIAVCIVGYFVYSMTIGAEVPPAAAQENKKSNKASGPGTAVASNGTGGAAGAGASGDAPADQKELVFNPMEVGPPQGGRDPFQPMGPTQAVMPKPAPTNTPPIAKPIPFVMPPVAQVPRPERPATPASLEKLLGPSSNAGADKGAVTPVAVEAPPAPSLAVTGVVLGDPTSGNPRNVAILRGGEGGERRFVSVGDYVGNGYTVVAVHADGVEIKDKAGNHRVTIKLGKSGDNARAN